MTFFPTRSATLPENVAMRNGDVLARRFGSAVPPGAKLKDEEHVR
jgi:hypothetical protein